MKKILLAGVAGVALVATGAFTANAADLGRPVYKAQPMVAPPPPPFSWTGCFAGAHWGWGWGKKDVGETEAFTSSRGTTESETFSGKIDTSGAIFGGQIGCDYQFGWGKGKGTAGGPGGWVIGIQADLAGTDINGFATEPFNAFLIREGEFEAAKFGTLKVKQDWLASVTGRLGITGFGGGFWSQTLWYIRGGVAWTHDKWDVSGATLLQEASAIFTGTGIVSPVDQSRTGWTVGAGWEWAFLPNWSAFVEWDHYDFGTKDLRAFRECNEGCESITFSTKQRNETVKIGVNYRFNFGKAPVAARY